MANSFNMFNSLKPMLKESYPNSVKLMTDRVKPVKTQPDNNTLFHMLLQRGYFGTGSGR